MLMPKANRIVALKHCKRMPVPVELDDSHSVPMQVCEVNVPEGHTHIVLKRANDPKDTVRVNTHTHTHARDEIERIDVFEGPAYFTNVSRSGVATLLTMVMTEFRWIPAITSIKPADAT